MTAKERKQAIEKALHNIASANGYGSYSREWDFSAVSLAELLCVLNSRNANSAAYKSAFTSLRSAGIKADEHRKAIEERATANGSASSFVR